ncbi:MAG: hypothetical protein WAV76_11025 [Bacteroidota bacterium]
MIAITNNAEKPLQTLSMKLHSPSLLTRLLSPIVDNSILVVWGLVFSFLFPETTRAFLLQSLRTVLTSPPIQWQWHTILIVVMLMVSSWETLRRLLSRFLKRFRRNYFFRAMPTSTFTWKTSKITGITENTPYCRIHQTKLIRKGDYFFCSDCGFRRHGHTSIAQVALEYSIISARANAIVNGYYQKTFFRDVISNFVMMRRKSKEMKKIKKDG